MPAPETSSITEIDRSQPLLHQHGDEIQQYGTLRNLPIALNSNAFDRLIAAAGTVDEQEATDMALYERISAEIGDKFLGSPGTLPST